MTESVARYVLVTWAVIMSALLKEVVHHLAKMFNAAFKENNINAALMIGLLGSLAVNGVALAIGALAVGEFFIGVATGTIVLGTSAIMVRFIVDMNWQSIKNLYTTARDQALYMYVKAATWWRNRNHKGDVKRRRAEETVRKVS